MKTLACVLLVALVACGVEARRGLHQAYASASSTSHGGRSRAVAVSHGGRHGKPTVAKAVSTAKGCGADSTTVAHAEDGAHVDAGTHTESHDCAKVKGTTVASGKGEKANVKAKNVVRSDKDVDVSIYARRVQKGEDVEGIAVVVVKEFEKYTYPKVAVALLSLASDEKTYGLYTATISVLFEKKGCDGLKLIIKGREREFLVYKVHDDVAKCLYYPCSHYDNAKSCCGAAQLEQPYCECYDGKCAWAKPEGHSGSYPYWICQDCNLDVPFCTCV